GPAGMETARMAAVRGHEVTLWEKGTRLGGNLRYAAMPSGKHEFNTLLDYYEHELPLNGVKIFLNREATAEEIIAEQADVVVLATGSRPADAPFPIKEPAKVVSALAVLEGSVIPGKRVVVIGGGSVGCETAVAVAEMGSVSAEALKFFMENDAETLENLRQMLNRGAKEVTLVELVKGIGRDIGISTRWIVLKCIHRLGVRVMDQHTVKEVSEAGVLVEKDGQETLLPADTVILAVGALPDDALVGLLQSKVTELHVIGDASKPRKITEAIREGFDLARSL
ncbi:MAG TPA: FAD-dependent oxidoreductase, partial [Candidatus Limnocylindrales bacterium]|nr:FAD-dependent oxidoreductase [Candidatus Limnocylindrales bacterium]